MSALISLPLRKRTFSMFVLCPSTVSVCVPYSRRGKNSRLLNRALYERSKNIWTYRGWRKRLLTDTVRLGSSSFEKDVRVLGQRDVRRVRWAGHVARTSNAYNCLRWTFCKTLICKTENEMDDSCSLWGWAVGATGSGSCSVLGLGVTAWVWICCVITLWYQ